MVNSLHFARAIMGLLNYILLSVIVLSERAFSSLIDYNLFSNCTCLPHYLCRDNMGDDIVDGLVDIRKSSPRPCANYFEICCEHPINGIIVNLPKPKMHIDESLKMCGYRGNSDSVDYRITGNELKTAEFAEFPWSIMVARVQPPSKQPMYQCGGSLIHPQVVLTAAHCLKNCSNGEWIVRAGEWNTGNEDEPIFHQEKEVKEFVLHPYYHPLSLKHDVALLILGEPFKLANNVRTVCLPNLNSNFLRIGSTKCIATGWGKNAFIKGKYSNILKKIEVPTIPRDQCQKMLRKTRLGNFFKLHRSFICAGGEMNQDTCKGDGGSPLVCSIPEYPGRYFQVGIVAWGIGCGEKDIPSAYANVALFVDWINRQLQARNLDTNYYKYI